VECKFAHIADVHVNDNNFEEISQCMDNTLAILRDSDVQFIIIAGDLWDHKLWTNSIAFRHTVDWVMRLASISPVYMIYGTPSHDVPGSYSIFNKVESTNKITVINEVTTIHIPEVTLAALPHVEISPEGSLEKTLHTRKEAIHNYINTLYEACDPNTFKIFIGHLAVIGSVIPQGTDGYEVDPKDLTRFDYSALGHIHPKNQKMPDNIQYSGSLWHTDTGDTSEKGFYIITLNDTGTRLKKEFHNAGSHPVVKFDAHFTDLGLDFLPKAEQVHSAKVRFTIYVPARYRGAFNEQNIYDDIMSLGAHSCKVVPRVLQEDIEVSDFGYTRDVKDKDWEGKYRAYCDAVDIETTDPMMLKVQELITEVLHEQEEVTL